MVAMLRNNANFNLMEKVARQVGRRMLRDFDEIRQLQTSVRGVADFALRAHRRAESAIISDLGGTRPNYGIRSAVFGRQEGKDPTRFWIVNALDGLENFCHGVPHWAIRLALEHKGEVVLAVILDVISNDLFAAERGDGSWLNDTRMRVTNRRRLTDMLVAIDLPTADHFPKDEADVVARICRKTGAVRSFGAPSLGLAYLAAGRIDAFYSPTSTEDDTSAGCLMLVESGGLAVPANPGASELGTGMIAACSSAFERFEALIGGR